MFLMFFICKVMFLTSMEGTTRIRSVERGICPIASLNVTN